MDTVNEPKIKKKNPEKANVIFIAGDFAEFKEIAKKHGLSFILLIKMLIENYDEALDKIEPIDAKGKFEFERTCLVLGEETITKLNEIAAAKTNNASSTTVLRSLIRGFIDKNRKPRDYVAMRYEGELVFQADNN